MAAKHPRWPPRNSVHIFPRQTAVISRASSRSPCYWYNYLCFVLFSVFLKTIKLKKNYQCSKEVSTDCSPKYVFIFQVWNLLADVYFYYFKYCLKASSASKNKSIKIHTWITNHTIRWSRWCAGNHRGMGVEMTKKLNFVAAIFLTGISRSILTKLVTHL